MMNRIYQDRHAEDYQVEMKIDIMIDLKTLNPLIEGFQVEKIIKKNFQMMKIMEDVHLELQYLSKL